MSEHLNDNETPTPTPSSPFSFPSTSFSLGDSLTTPVIEFGKTAENSSGGGGTAAVPFVFQSAASASPSTVATPRRPQAHRVGGSNSSGRGHKKKHHQSSSSSSASTSPSSSPSFLFLPTTTNNTSPATLSFGSDGREAADAPEKPPPAAATSNMKRTELSEEARQSPLYRALCRVVCKRSALLRGSNDNEKKMAALAEKYTDVSSLSMSMQIICHLLFDNPNDGTPPKHPRDVAAGRDAYGRTPLHIAVHHGAHVEAIRLLLEVYPEAAYQTDNRNSIPLQVVFHAGGGVGEAGTTPDSSLFGTIQLRVVQALLQAHPAAAFQEAASQYVGPSFSPDTETPKFLERMDGEAATFSVGKTSKPMEKFLPKNDSDEEDNDNDDHDEQNNRPSSPEDHDEIRASNNVPYKAPHVPGKKLSLLHLAVANSSICEAGVLDAILEANPASALELDDMGRTPLHLLLTPTSPLMPCTDLGPSTNRRSVILTLLAGTAATVNPREVVPIQDVLGRTPLHLACHHGVEDVEVLQALLHAYPDAVVTHDKSGQTPLHVVFTGLAASHRIDHAETTHCAISLSLIQRLLQAHPEAAKMEIENRQQTALHLAAIQGAHCEEGVFEALLAANPAALLQRDFSGRMPLHLLLASLSSVSLPSLPSWSTTEETEQPRVLQRVIRLVRTLLMRPTEDLDAATPPNDKAPAIPDPRAIAAGQDSSGSMALHVAAFHGASHEELIQLLLHVYPQAAHHVDISGNLPIHLALSCVPITGSRPGRAGEGSKTTLGTTNVIRLLLQANPHPFTEKKGAASVLHLAAAHASHFEVEVFDMLQRDNPSFVLHPDGSGQTPLHRLLATPRLASDDDSKNEENNRRFLQQMSVLLREAQTTLKASTDPATATMGADRDATPPLSFSSTQILTTTAAAAKDKKGLTPLHLAVSKREHRRVDILETLLQACPAAASSRDGEGRLALHSMFFSSGGDRLELAPLQRLVQAYPPAVTEADKWGYTPLHLLLRMPCQAGVFDFLLQAGPEAAAKCDKEGLTPLHVALSKWPQDSEGSLVGRHLARVVSRIVEVCPQAVSIRKVGTKTCSPLYHAVEKDRAKAIIEQLIRRNPAAAAELWEEDYKATPLSVAVNNSHWDVCHLLLTHCPQSARTLLFDGQTVLHQIRRLDVLEQLLEAWPEALLQQTVRNGWTPLHSWMWAGTLTNRGSNRGFSEPDGLLRALLKIRVWNGDLFLRALQMTDSQGLTPLHHALARFSNNGYVTHGTITQALEQSHFTMMLRSFPGVLFLRVEPAEENDEDDDNDENENANENQVELFLTSIMGRICQLSTAPELVQLLFQEFADFVPESNGDEGRDDNDDHDPLAMWFIGKACENSDGHGSVALVRLCHDRHAACVRTRSNLGDLPLHVACRQSSCTLEMVQQLTELYGAALTMEDGMGQVPFQVACWNDAPLNVTYHLLRSAPDVLMM